MKYTDLVIDLYGTLVDIHTDENDLVWEKTALFFGYYGAAFTGEELKTAFREAMESREAAAGQSYECFPDIPCEEVMASLLSAKGVENADALGFAAAQLFRVLSTDYIRLYPHVKEALADLRRRGCRLWLLSNAQHVFTAYELRHLGLTECFDGILLSSDYRCRKPDLRFFTALLEEHQLQVENCLMIGNDREMDIAGAKGAGMATLYMHTGLTPSPQAEADPALHPSLADKDTRHYEYEGDDWTILSGLIAAL